MLYFPTVVQFSQLLSQTEDRLMDATPHDNASCVNENGKHFSRNGSQTKTPRAKAALPSQLARHRARPDPIDTENLPADLSEADYQALAAITRADRLWSRLSDLEAQGIEREILEHLATWDELTEKRSGRQTWLVWWQVGEEVRVTLTAWGAWQCRVLIAEHMERITVEEWKRDRKTNRQKHIRVQRRYLFPHWRRSEGRDDLGDPMINPRRRPMHAPDTATDTFDLEGVPDQIPGPDETVAMMEEVDREGRPRIDLETGVPIMVPMVMFGQAVPIKKRIKGKR